MAARTGQLRIHITGASGSGVTTLGKAMSRELGSAHLDTDDCFWLPTESPYTIRRPREQRLALMHEAFDRAASTGWILAGSLNGWGDSLIPLFDLVIFISTPTELRLQRLQARETARFGSEAIAPGGSRHEEYEAFIKWAASYEVLSHEGRNRARHEAWLAQLPCPVLRLDGRLPVEFLLHQAMSELG
jgi:adenylate kinase family enzyme